MLSTSVFYKTRAHLCQVREFETEAPRAHESGAEKKSRAPHQCRLKEEMY
jgi:hypothetical protein